MNEKPPEFSVIVLFGRGELEPCLKSLIQQRGVSFEVIGVVGGEVPSLDNSRVRFLSIAENNPALRRNRAVSVSKGGYLAFIDDDAIAEDDWLSKARGIFEAHPELAGFGGVNISPEDFSWREELTDLILRDRYFGSGGGGYEEVGDVRIARPGEVHLSNFFLRRDVYETAGGFNEGLGYGGEDSEMIYVIKKKTGLEFMLFPELKVRHRRREFGWELLRRNFLFRRNNGKLMVLYPDMYLWNRSLIFGILLGFFIILCSIIYVRIAIIFWVAYAIFFIFYSLFRLRKRRWLFIISPVAYLFHHLSYFLGLTFGVIEGLFMGRSRLRRFIGRDKLE